MIEPQNGLGASEVNELIQQAMSGDVVSNYDATPTEGATITIADSTARIINLLLWPAANLNKITVVLPPTLLGRRVFLYTDKAIAEVDVITNQSGVLVRNGVISLNMFDQTVFNTASLTIWARVVTS